MRPNKNESKEKSKHQKLEDVRSLDRISNMPENVGETILMCLPTRDAVRTSILSRKWRHVWARLPQFVLDRSFWENVVEEHSTRITLTKILYQLLINHDGPINKFTLSNPKLESCPEIDNLISLLARSHLEDLTLEMSSDWHFPDPYLLPNSFFSCQNLRHLRLRSCSIRSSPDFNGFGMLITLALVEVTIDAETLSSLISGCPLLRVLELDEINLDINIYIDAPSLKTFTYKGINDKISFERVPVLASVSINCSEFSIEQFFQPLVSLESLKLDHCLLETFEDSYTTHVKELPTSLIYLKDLTIYNIRFEILEELLFTLWLLRSSPNLKFIEFEFDDNYDENPEETRTHEEMKNCSDIWLSELKEVNLCLFCGKKLELEFTKLLLAKSSSLKKFHIQLSKEVDNGFEILKQVTKFPRLSSEAEIIFA